ncbi:hypothetical protein OSB04_un000907 [Centaurea solstitialis]|uniref:Reverse transcriptase domain-containing protein n=1 Tax=Centaurea solstitialis TaxID=347529 RepID=A0AA38VRE2_9ASTR|nr:hypothetical protein OSB04_un000907 [Centaurea solstitialis]
MEPSDGLGEDDPTMVVDDVLSSDDESEEIPQSTHKSVFDRLKPDARLQFDKKELNFAKAVGKEDNALTFFPLASKDQTCVRIPKELASEVLNTHRSTLYGYFLGPRLHFPVVERYVRTAWGKFGFSDAMMNNNGMYFFRFNDVGGCNQVVEAGPLMIRGVPLFVEHWDPVKGLNKPIHTSCPLWVKLHNVPLVAFNKEGISRIASALGVPKQMDACTATMCDKAWGRPGFAKVLIETWAVGELKRELHVLIPDLNGGDDVRVSIKVEYDWEPSQCSHCLVFGHKDSTCIKAMIAQKNKGKKPVVDEQGFTMVKRKEWRPKVVEGSTSGTKGVEMKQTEDSHGDLNPIKQDDGSKGSGGLVGTTPSQQEVSPRELAGNMANTHSQGENIDVNDQEKTCAEVLDVASREQSAVRHLSVPLEVPLRTILKNTNRFSPLADDGAKRDKDKGKEHAKPSVVMAKSVLDAPRKPTGTPRHSRLELGGGAIQQVCKSTFGRWSWVSNQATCSYGTQIILAWDPSLFDVMIIGMISQCLHTQIRVRGSDMVFFATFVYGANRSVERQLLWSELRKFQAIMGSKPWVLTGDFNALLFPHDALGGSSVRNSDMVDFFECVDDIEVFDLRYTGIQHTWCQKPKDESGLKRKLDRVLANIEFTSTFANASVNFLPRGISDHSPSLLSFKGGIRKRRWGFKFDNYLIHNNRFIPIVADVWNQPVNGTFMFQLTQKLKSLKKPLRELRNTYGDLHLRANKLKTELDVVQLAADLDPFSVALREDLEVLRVAYQQARRDEELAVMQRAKVKWLREGDPNTKYFHMVVKEKRHAQQIHSIRKLDGNFVFDDDVPVAFVENLKMLLGTQDETLVPEMPSHFIGNEKAPGSDGYSARFFKAAWSVVGGDVTTAIHNFFYRSKLDKELNHTLLCLLPKSPNATSVSDFRPISCCTVLYKCISKILVDRIKPYLDGLVSRSQSAFIPGRRIVDNILMAHELVVGYHLHSGPPRCAFKIDIRKAYDMIDWRFLFNMLSGVGFHPALIRWIKEMVSTTSYSIALNGETHGFFKGARGIRQGDPLSPYLFTLVMEGFSMILKECIREASSFGYHPGCEELDITHLCFADDLFVFSSGNVGSVDILKQALQLFSAKSGLSPSLEKSEVFFGNVEPQVQEAIVHSLSFKPGTFPIRYLGVPLSPLSLKVAEYGGLISKALCRDFLWAQGNTSKGKCKVAWDVVCRPVSCGGLGIKRLAVWNRALLSKHIWDLCSNRKSLWVAWISRFCVRQDSIWSIRAVPRWSWSFRKLLTLREEIRPYIRVRIGNGKTTNAWEDNWYGTRLSAFISYRAIHNAGFGISWKVSDLVLALNGVWPNAWMELFPQLANNLIPIINDEIHITDSTRIFSVSKVYNSLSGSFPEVPWWKCVWFKGHIPKHAFCLWIACTKRLPTQDRISSWKHDPPDLTCPFCGTEQDSHTHLFFTCQYTKEVWNMVRLKMEWEDFPESWDDIVLAIADTSTAPKMLTHKLALAASVYTIWRERNRRLFRGDKRSVLSLTKDICDVVWMRAAWKTGITHSDESYVADITIMSHETDPSEYRSHGSPEHPGSENGNSRSRTAVPERDPYSDSDADSHQVPARSASPARPFGPETHYGLRGRRTARKSVPLPTRMTFRIPTGDGAGPSRVRGQGGSSSSSSSSSSGSPPPYRPSSPIVRVPPPQPAARPPPFARPPPIAPIPRHPHMARAPVLCLRGMTPTERQEVARLARGQDVHEHLLDHHDHMIDSLLGVAGADSQQLSRIVALLSHTMASLHHLYTVVYLVVTVVVLLLMWAVWRVRT